MSMSSSGTSAKSPNSAGQGIHIAQKPTQKVTVAPSHPRGGWMGAVCLGGALGLQPEGLKTKGVFSGYEITATYARLWSFLLGSPSLNATLVVPQMETSASQKRFWNNCLPLLLHKPVPSVTLLTKPQRQSGRGGFRCPGRSEVLALGMGICTPCAIRSPNLFT